ncbi:uncharacterized protein LOC116663327 [Camelus ferus]|uniref:Uncharacterized protein LOC116663327 n=1 Tax=Camelus ferus TaxID=419612 RepID=A0A8B8SXR4_CAMFR|nr:uncharacterized protein LOC116663327 [Camelus ferus]
MARAPGLPDTTSQNRDVGRAAQGSCIVQPLTQRLWCSSVLPVDSEIVQFSPQDTWSPPAATPHPHPAPPVSLRPGLVQASAVAAGCRASSLTCTLSVPVRRTGRQVVPGGSVRCWQAAKAPAHCPGAGLGALPPPPAASSAHRRPGHRLTPFDNPGPGSSGCLAPPRGHKDWELSGWKAPLSDPSLCSWGSASEQPAGWARQWRDKDPAVVPAPLLRRLDKREV